MKKAYLILFAAMFCAGTIVAQNKEKKEDHLYKKVEILDEDGEQTVTIETKKNGKKTKEVLTGDDAQAWIAEHEENQWVSDGNEQRRVIVDVDVDNVIKYVEEELERVGEEIEEELEDLEDELEKLDIEEILEQIGVSVEESLNGMNYSFSCADGSSKNIMVFKSDEGGDGVKVRVEVECETEDGDKKEQRVVVKKSVSDEGEISFEEELQLDDLEIFPNPAADEVQVRFTSSSKEATTIELRDINGRIVKQASASGKGAQSINLDVSELATGNYILHLKQGERTTSKKLVID